MPIQFFLPQVTRIPIVGPQPYNTLVCVQAESNCGPMPVTVGKLSRWSWTVPTTFVLAGFDQRAPPAFDHSTTAYMSSIGPFEDSTWLCAVDAVSGAGFNSADGSYFVNVDIALMPGQPLPETCLPDLTCLYFAKFQVTSFVLCNEPPLPASQSLGQPIANRADLASIIKPQRGFTAADRIRELLGVPGVATPALSSVSNSGGNKNKCDPCRGK